MMGDLGRSRKVVSYTVIPPLFSQFRYNYRDRDSDVGASGPANWRIPRLPGKEGKSMSIKNSAKAGLAASLGVL